MGRAEAHAKLYQMVSDMTVANGYNYDWTIRGGGNAYFGATVDNPAMITISVLDEENVDDDGGIGSFEYMNNATVEMYITVTSPVGDQLSSDTQYDNLISVSRGIDDVQNRYTSNAELCNEGVQSFLYKGCDVEEIPNEDSFAMYRATLRFEMLYRKYRGVL